MVDMRCFVASALGRSDVDSVFRTCIKPTLKKLGIRAYRVDQIVHNDDIDNKILQLLAEADFCIADLTYARPSVYFEAGYAIPQKPVIFVARKDHFKARDDDPEGNLRVHFDLQMKNIIPWGGSEKKFKEALRRRVLYVTARIRANLANRQERDAERRTFLNLSQRARLALIRNAAEAVLRTRGFTIESRPESHNFRAIRRRRGFEIQLMLFAQATFTRRALELAYAFFAHGKWDETRTRQHSPLQRKIVILLFASLESLPLTRLHKAFPMHAPWLDSGLLKWAFENDVPTSLESIVAPLGHVQSKSEFEERFCRLLDPIFIGMA